MTTRARRQGWAQGYKEGPHEGSGGTRASRLGEPRQTNDNLGGQTVNTKRGGNIWDDRKEAAIRDRRFKRHPWTEGRNLLESVFLRKPMNTGRGAQSQIRPNSRRHSRHVAQGTQQPCQSHQSTGVERRLNSLPREELTITNPPATSKLEEDKAL